jgi:hypothetical protein
MRNVQSYANTKFCCGMGHMGHGTYGTGAKCNLMKKGGGEGCRVFEESWAGPFLKRWRVSEEEETIRWETDERTSKQTGSE